MRGHCVRAVALVLSILLALLVGAVSPGAARAADELETRTVSSYDMGADGNVHVTISALVTNRDPSTERRASGRVFFYTAAAFAVHDAASNLSARSGTTPLSVETRDRDESLRVVSVRFNRDLYFNESIQIALEYDLTAVRAAQLLIGRQYAFVPAIGQGARSLIRITAPADRRLTITSANCARIADSPVTYQCGSSTDATDYRAGGRCAFTVAAPRWECGLTDREFTVIPFEAAAADLSLSVRTTRAQMSTGPVEVRVQYFTGEDAWAARVEEIIRRGLPALEEANGFAYPGPPTVEIIESGYRDTSGYEGLASTRGRIQLTPVVDDQTVLHEVSHLWSGMFGSRWLAEGMADYTANVAARRLGLKPQVVREPLPTAPRLEEWGPLRSQLAVSRTEREAEEAGYARSLRFLELLTERAGAKSIAAANATLAQERTRGTARTYLDTIEDVTGQAYAPLFGDWALTTADVGLLPQRATIRGQAAALRERGKRLGLGTPADLTQSIAAWEFDRASGILTTATAALDQHEQTLASATARSIDLGTTFRAAYARSSDQAAISARDELVAFLAVSDALDRSQAARSPLMRLGLLGAAPLDREAEMRAALVRGDFRAASVSAARLQARIASARRTGAIRLSLTLGTAILLSALVVFARRRGRVRTVRGGERSGGSL